MSISTYLDVFNNGDCSDGQKVKLLLHIAADLQAIKKQTGYLTTLAHKIKLTQATEVVGIKESK